MKLTDDAILIYIFFLYNSVQTLLLSSLLLHNTKINELWP